MDFETMSVAELMLLQTDIERHLQKRQSILEAQLQQLKERRLPRSKGPPKGIKIPPKYRHPSSGATWSGRGAMAKWLAAEIRQGRCAEDFLID